MERDGVVGFKQFCTIFPHISAAYLAFIDPHISDENADKTDMPN